MSDGKNTKLNNHDTIHFEQSYEDTLGVGGKRGTALRSADSRLRNMVILLPSQSHRFGKMVRSFKELCKKVLKESTSRYLWVKQLVLEHLN